MAYRHALLNFSKGELSPELEARFDISIYNAALRQAKNVVVRRTGGVAKRMGTRFVAECLGDADEPVKLVPFQFSDEQGYCLEFGQAYMRPAALGGVILEEGLAVTAITNEAQAKVTSAHHDYAVGDGVWFEKIEGMDGINGRFLTVTQVVDENNFRVDFDSTNAGVFAGTVPGRDEGVVRVEEPPAPPPAPTVPSVSIPPTRPTTGSGSVGGYTPGGKWLGQDFYIDGPL